MKQLKPIHSLRNTLTINPTEICSRVKTFVNAKIDFDVYLPSRGRNLQRDDVWDIDQRRELVWSLITGRHIPHLSIINKFDDSYEIIDGKQRLRSILMFVNDQFTIEIQGDWYLFSELPEEYRNVILATTLRYYIVNEIEHIVSDDEKIKWFKLINFAGTAQDLEYLQNLK